jgi:hypothetical protein
MSWPRNDHTPKRFLLASDAHQHATFTVDAHGHEYGKIEDDIVDASVHAPEDSGYG